MFLNLPRLIKSLTVGYQGWFIKALAPISPPSSKLLIKKIIVWRGG
jgi:hypothetical protein